MRQTLVSKTSENDLNRQSILSHIELDTRFALCIQISTTINMLKSNLHFIGKSSFLITYFF